VRGYVADNTVAAAAGTGAGAGTIEFVKTWAQLTWTFGMAYGRLDRVVK